MSTMKIKRGTKASLPSSANVGELLFTTDTKEVYIGNGTGVPNTLLVRKNNFASIVDPSVTDDISQGYSRGSIWINILTPAYFICLNNVAGSAIWHDVMTGSIAHNDTSSIQGGAINDYQHLTTAQVTKLSGIAVNATKTESSSTNGNIKNNGSEITVYTHPANHTASVITQDASNRFVTDVQIAAWNAKLDASTYTAANILSKLLTVDGTTSTLDADLLDGQEGSYYANIPARLGFTPENVANKGVVNGYAGLDSTGKVTQNIDAAKITGTISLSNLPAGALDRLITVANQTARFALTTANVQLGDTVQQSDTSEMFFVVDEANLGNVNGYRNYTAGTATSVPWSGVQSKPTTLGGYGITDATPSSHIGSGGASHAVATTTVAGFESAADKAKLDGIAANATKVELSATNGNIKVNGSELVVYTHIKMNYVATTDPAVTNDSSQGYVVGSEWVNTITDAAYFCVDNTLNAAKWLLYAIAYASPTPRSFVSGCRLEWVSTTALKVGTGSINLSGSTYEITSGISIGWGNIATGTTKLPSTWYYVYLKMVSGALTPYISSALPTVDAFGNSLTSGLGATSKYHPTHGRFLGSFKTGVSQNIIQFLISGNYVNYIDLGYGYILQAGGARSKTAVNCRMYVPYTASIARVYYEDNSNGSGYKYVGNFVSFTERFCRNKTGEVDIAVMNDSIYYDTDADNINMGIHGYYEEV